MSVDAQSPVFTWIDSALSHAEAGTLPNFADESRLAAALSLGHPGSPNAAVIPALREAETLEPWYDILVDLAQVSRAVQTDSGHGDQQFTAPFIRRSPPARSS